MKGLITYSSLTGNTKRYAEKLYEAFKESGEWTLLPMKEVGDGNDYDVVLAGGWIDRSTLNAEAKKWVEHCTAKRLGIFATLGAMPNSPHGQNVYENLQAFLIHHEDMGIKLLPGKVDSVVIERVRAMPEGILPEHIRKQMIETGEVSRYATEEEYKEAIAYFQKRLHP